MKTKIEELNEKERKFISRNAILIEKTLEYFGCIVRIAEFKIHPETYEYRLEIAMGTDLSEIEKHSRDIALAVASPTGKVKLEIPIPGRSLIGIKVPKPSKEDLEKMIDFGPEETNTTASPLKQKIADICYSASDILRSIGERMSRNHNRKPLT